MNREILVTILMISGWFHNLYAVETALANSTTREKIDGTQTVTNAVVYSSFELDRDPFWPVGFEPGDPLKPRIAPIAEPEPIAKPVPWPELRVLGFIHSEKSRMALLQDIGLVQTGDIVSRRVGDLYFEWKITRITGDVVRYERIGYRNLDTSE